MENETPDNEHFFSVELKSRAHLKNVTMTNGTHDSVLVEGTIGELLQASFVEGLILEVVGRKGILRINLTENDIAKVTQQAAKEANDQ